MPENALKIGWIGMGRMGFPMAERLLKAGYDVAIWNRTRAKAEPLAASGGRIVDRPADLAHVDVLFSIVSTGKDLDEVLFRPEWGRGQGQACRRSGRLLDHRGRGIRRDPGTACRARRRLRLLPCQWQCQGHQGRQAVRGRLRSGGRVPQVEPLVKVFAPRGVSYVGEGELARICKIAHNVMLGVVIENLIEITLLTNKMGVPRHAFLAFLNNGVMGSMFTAYKSPALVNLDWATTFTPGVAAQGPRSRPRARARERCADAGDGGDAGNAAGAFRCSETPEADPEAYLAKDFAALMETMALAAGMKLTSEEQKVPTGLEN